MPKNVPTAEQIQAYLLAHDWEMGESGSAAYLMVAMGHTIRILHEPTEYDRDKAVFDISLAEGRHPADVRDDILTYLPAAKPTAPVVDAEAGLARQMRYRSLGAYRLFWKAGGSSVAVVGQLFDGSRWYACANWTTGSADASLDRLVRTDWSLIARAEAIPTREESE